MRIILKNIRIFAVNQTVFFVLFQICIIVSSLLMLFAFGAYQNYRVMQQGIEERQLECQAYFYDKDNDGQTYYVHARKQQLDDCIHDLSDSFCDNIEFIAVQYRYSFPDGFSDLFSRFSFRNGMYCPYDTAFQNLRKHGDVMEGFEGFSAAEYNSGMKICYATVRTVDEQKQVWINGIPYQAKSITKVSDVEIPFPAADDDLELTFVYLQFVRPPGYQEYQSMKSVFNAHFDSQVRWDDPMPFDIDDYSYYATIILIAILIALCAAVNVAILYQYILERRRKMLAVFMICGCPRIQAFFMYLAEILLLSAAGFLIGASVWKKFLMPRLTEMLPYIDSVDYRMLSVRAFILLMLSLLIIAGFICNRLVRTESIVQIGKEGVI